MKLYFLDDDLSGTWTTYSSSAPTAHFETGYRLRQATKW